jgi:hypothetical protein
MRFTCEFEAVPASDTVGFSGTVVFGIAFGPRVSTGAGFAGASSVAETGARLAGFSGT